MGEVYYVDGKFVAAAEAVFPIDDLAEEFHDLLARRRVEFARWFVGKDQRGLRHECACNCHPLLLPAGEFERTMRGPFLQAHQR